MARRRDAVTPTRRPVLLVLGLLVVGALVVAGTLVLADRRSGPETPTFCAGVGLIGPVAATPEEALRAWLATAPGEPRPSTWERTSHQVRPQSGRRSASFVSDESKRFVSVSMGTGGTDADGRRLGTDEWHADGACVRSPG